MTKTKAVEFPKKLIVSIEGFPDGYTFCNAEPGDRADEFKDGTRVGVYVLTGTGEVRRAGYVNED